MDQIQLKRGLMDQNIILKILKKELLERDKNLRNIKEKLRKIKVIERIYKISLREVLGREGRKIREEEIL